MAIDNSIIFGGVNSADFGIYISGEGVFNAPERDVEMIEIPGRNGALALDKGRFKNISVTYPAFNYEPNDYDTFAERLADFRNAICAQRGYQRLEDTFHPDEYRMAAYVEGLEIKPIKYNTASEFDLVFDCKPQRWLKSGETAVTVASGDTLTNPTRFESGPLLEVDGYGTIGFNGYEIELINAEMGDILIYEGYTGNKITVLPDYSLVNANDELAIDSITADIYIEFLKKTVNPVSVVQDSSTIVVASGSGTVSYDIFLDSKTYTLRERFSIDGSAATYGVAQTLFSGTINVRVNYNASGSDYSLYGVGLDVRIAENGQITFIRSVTLLQGREYRPSSTFQNDQTFSIYADSSLSLLGDPTYIDCDFGEAYMIKDGSIVSLNRYIDLGSDLPKLASGANEITFDDTITELKVHPRWWKV